LGFALGTNDIVILAVSLLLTVSVGLLAARKQERTAGGYFLASRRLPWYVIGLAYVSTSVSSEQIVGTIGMAYMYGMGVANWEWFTLPHYLVLILFFVPVFLRNRITTVPELLTKRYGPLCGDIYSWVMLFAYIIVFLVTVVYSGSLALASLTGLNMYLVMWVMILLVGLYTVKGGLSSVMWTDAVQCIMLVGGGVLLFLLALKQTPGGWTAMVAADPDRFHLYWPAKDPIAPFLGLVSGVFTIGVFYGAGNQIMMQRILGARSRWDGTMGVVFAGFINFLRPLVTCFLGFVVFYWIYHLHRAAPLADKDTAFPFALRNMAPEWGLRGIVLAGFLAAVMSTISAQANSTATIFSLDVYKKLFNRAATDPQLVRAGRIASLISLILAGLLAPMVKLCHGIFFYFQQGVTYLATPFAAVIILGIVWKRTTYKGAVFGLLSGFAIQAAVVVGLNKYPYHLHLHWYYNAFIAQAITMLGIVIVSLLTRPPSEDSWKPFLWTRKSVSVYDEGIVRPWYHSWVLWAAVYAGIWSYLYHRFW
jgi:SSS family solute:Na+ symporter